MKLSLMRRTLGVASLALMTQACLFMVEPGTTPNNTENNTADPCLEKTCSPGQTCDSETGECGVVSCGFTDEEDGWNSSCPDGEVCHLDPNGNGYCAAPCGGDDDCVSSGSSCDQKYKPVVGGGICVPDDASNASCFDTRYEGRCLGDEICECADGLCEVGECVDFGPEPTCFARPDEGFGPGEQCGVFECDFDEDDDFTDAQCFFPVGGEGPELVGLCHVNTDEAGAGVFSSGYCDDPCFNDGDCMNGAVCNGDQRCVEDVPVGPSCRRWEFRDDDDGMCKPHLCNSPGTPDGDEQCFTESGLTDLLCGVSSFDVGSEGLCYPDCRVQDVCPDDPARPKQTACDVITGYCVDDKQDEFGCSVSCPAGSVCGQGTQGMCVDSTLKTRCGAGGNSCREGEDCKDVPGGPLKSCERDCSQNEDCPVGAFCDIDPAGGGSCVTACNADGDCKGLVLTCSRVGSDEGDRMGCVPPSL